MRSADMLHYDSQTSSFMSNMKAVAEQYSDNAAVTFSTCDAWKLSPRSDHYHLWENHKGSLLWKSHIFYKISAFQKLTNILVHTSKLSSKRRRREQLMRNLILDERDRLWLSTRTRLSLCVGAFGLFRSSTVLWFLSWCLISSFYLLIFYLPASLFSNPPAFLLSRVEASRVSCAALCRRQQIWDKAAARL